MKMANLMAGGVKAGRKCIAAGVKWRLAMASMTDKSKWRKAAEEAAAAKCQRNESMA